MTVTTADPYMRIEALERALQKAQRLGKISTWEFNTATGDVIGPPQMYRLFGLTPQSGISLDALQAFYAPGEEARLNQIFDEVKASPGPFEYTLHIRQPDGTPRVLAIEGDASDDGGTLYLYGTMRDITKSFAAEEALRESEQRYRSVIRAMAEGVIVTDAKGVILDVNRRAVQILGSVSSDLSDSNALGLEWEAVTENGADFPSDRYPLAQVLREQRPAVRTIMGLPSPSSADERMWISVNAEPIFSDDETTLEGAVMTFHDITEQLAYERTLKHSRHRQRELTRRLHKAQEEERHHIAREIHDEIGQALTTLRLDISWLRDHRDEDVFMERADKALEQATTTIELVRRISRDLRPSILDHFGLSAALEWQAEQFAERTGQTCTFIDTADEDQVAELPDDCALALFRIAQEALTNVVRHAEASAVTSTLAFIQDRLVLSISDNGRGIEEGDVVPGKSLGLLNMHERIGPWMGTVDISGSPGKGTTITVSLPFPVLEPTTV